MNRLADAASPYLQQHADNPVDWLEWGEEAFARARERDKPLFLSVGYSSCHWCHVMAHESFEDPETAAALNEHFVPVKVDREERPDVDAVYMSAVQAMTGHGGWPMSVFLTPDGVPFFAGTYWPKEQRQGMPGFDRVLQAVREAWESQRDDVEASAAKVASHLDRMQALEGPGDEPDADVAERAAALCVRAWDARSGGFGGAPKFPQAMTIDFLLACHQRTADDAPLRAAVHSLEQMSRGGIYDHVGGGFARYSVDDVWLVPHFEKMLYDNALLLRAYTHAWQVTGEPRLRRVAAETAEYLLRDMRHPGGGFYSATDADSEGVEGKFFVWSLAEFRDVVAGAGEDPDFWAGYYGVTEGGNFEGANILYEAAERDEADAAFSERVDRVRASLFERREQRVHPGLDDKVLASWNGLALGALAEAGAVLSAPRLVDAARDCAAFLADELVVGGRLRHSWKEGHGAGEPLFAEDVAFLAQGLLSLYEADPDPRWIGWARELAELAEAEFADPEAPGSYFATAHSGERLITRPRDLFDNATPAPSSVMADVGLRLAALTGDPEHARRAEAVLSAFAGRASQAPTGYGELLRALERRLQGPQEVAVVGRPEEPETAALASAYRRTWRPGSVLAVGEPDGGAEVPLLTGRERVGGAPAAYVCRNFACERPVTDPDELLAALAR